MSEGFWLKHSIEDEGPCSDPHNIMPTKQMKTNTYIPREVFRNDTTAVEVVVKQVKNKNNVESKNPNIEALEETNDRLYEDVEKFKTELNKANRNVEDMKQCFRLVTFEMAKLLEAANQRELKTQTQFLVLQLENEKLKTVLESKTNLLRKLRKELLGTKRIFKAVIKGIRYVVPLSETAIRSDLDYSEFESDMKTKLAKAPMRGSDEVTFETTFSSKV